MEYFNFYPTARFNNKDITNTTIRLNFFNAIKNNSLLFEHKIIKDGDKPEDVAYEYYNDPNLYWIILMSNGIVDPFYGWLLSESDLYDYVNIKYAGDIYGIHHYEATDDNELPEGTWVNSTDPFSAPVSNFSYEEKLNEEKRQIQIIKSKYLSQIIAEYTNILRNQ